MSELDKATIDFITDPNELRFHAENPITEDGRIHVTPELLFAVADKIDGLRAELTRRDEIIARLKEDAERLASEYRSYDPVDEIATCVHCGKEKEFDYILAQYFYSHTADCPITLHRALMKELE